MSSHRTAPRIAAALAVAGALGPAAAQDAPPTPPTPPTQPPPPTQPAFEPPPILAQRLKGLAEKDADGAVEAGLGWLRRHVADDGRWDCDGFDARCAGTACGGAGSAVHDPGVTGLALLAFLGAGKLPTEGPDAALVRGGLTVLTDRQDSEGCIGARTSAQFLYGHAAATMAVAEAAWLTGDAALAVSARRGAEFIVAAQNPYLGWRYGVRTEDNDTSVSAWCVLALRTCEFAGTKLRGEWTAGARAWFDKMTDGESGLVGYQQRGGTDARPTSLPRPEPPPRPKPAAPDPPVEPRKPGDPLPDLEPVAHRETVRTVARGRGDVRASMVPSEVEERWPLDRGSALTVSTAVARTLFGGREDVERVEQAVAHAQANPPRGTAARDRFLDLHYLLHAGLLDAQRPLSGRPPTDRKKRAEWRSWRDVAVADLVATQRGADAGCAAGSWDSGLDPFGASGGRVYTTSMAVLALEAPHRFPKVWDEKVKPLPKPPTKR